MFIGVGTSRVKLFEETKNAPAVVFIDEIESVGGKCGGPLTQNL